MGWSRERLAALAVSAVVGAIVGVVSGFLATRYATLEGLEEWYSNYPAGAHLWAGLGAVVVGGSVFVWGTLSKTHR